MRPTTRRDMMRSGAAAALVPPTAIQLLPSRVEAAPADMRAAIALVTNGAPLRPGRVKIEMPPLSENGNTVPITVTAESPMTGEDHVKAIHLFNEKNPQANVISAWLGPRAGQAMLQTRARLADSQTIVAVAQMSDGTFWTDSASVIVTLGACLEDLI